MRALADNVADDRLLRRRECHEPPRIAVFFGVFRADALLLFCNAIPLFIKLDQIHLQVAHQPVMKTFATCPNAHAEIHHKVKAQRKDEVIRLRVTTEQKRTLIQAAQSAGLEVSACPRSLALREAGRAA